MLESLMLILLGFLVASLLALIGLRLVWRRAVSVTRERAEAAPVTDPPTPLQPSPLPSAPPPSEPAATPAQTIAPKPADLEPTSPERAPADASPSSGTDQPIGRHPAPDTARLDELERRIADLEARLTEQDRQLEDQKRDLRTVRMERDAAIEEAQRLHRTADAETQKRKANELLFKRLEGQARDILNQIADITGAASSTSQPPTVQSPTTSPKPTPRLPDLPPEPNNDRTAANGTTASAPLAENSAAAGETLQRPRVRAEELTLSERIKALQKGVAE